MSWIGQKDEALPWRLQEVAFKALDEQKRPHKKVTNRFALTSDDWGTWDYSVFTTPTQAIIVPVSKAALYWLEDNLNESVGRYGMEDFEYPGFIVTKKEFTAMSRRMDDIGLISEEDYRMAEEEAHQYMLDDRPMPGPEDGR